MFMIRIVTAVSMLAVAGAALAAPIGTLQSEGHFSIRSADQDSAVAFNQAEYTFFSGDTISVRSGPAILNLNNGGGLGFPRGSVVTVTRADDGRIEAVIESGALLYAFPDGRNRFVFRVGDFTATGQPPEARAIQVASNGESVGTVERTADGSVKATVRSGALYIANGDSVRYQVDAGETVGFLNVQDQPMRTRTAMVPAPPTGRVPPILIQSPEQVGTNDNFLVRWEAIDPVDGDYIVIAEEGAAPDEFETVISSDEGNVLEFEAPGDPGDYEIRFIDGETGEIKRFVYLDVVENIIGAYWWDDKLFGAVIGIAAGGTAVYIGSRIGDDDDPDPVSP